ncbi:MAG: TRIC cation channel family protein [Microbacteriaceae bacterium]|nr:TRIC cation channel family protein [Microbacteriaceae bacterium]
MNAAENVLEFYPIWVDLAGAILGGILGAYAAARLGTDVTGALIVAVVTGLGGGMIRDVLLQQGPPVALASPWLLAAAAGAGLLTFLFSGHLHRLPGRRRIAPFYVVVDAFFLAAWTVVGVAKGYAAGLPIVSCVFLGVLTAVGGGIARDVLLGRRPLILQPGTLEAGAALIGAAAQAAATLLIGSLWGALVGLVVVAAVRILSLALRWQTRPARIVSADEPGDSRGAA